MNFNTSKIVQNVTITLSTNTDDFQQIKNSIELIRKYKNKIVLLFINSVPNEMLTIATIKILFFKSIEIILQKYL